MISVGLFWQTSNRPVAWRWFFFRFKRSHGNPFFDDRLGHREIGVSRVFP